MVQCLYKKFTIRKGMTFNQSKFVQVLKSVGQLALQTLKANNPLLQKSEIESIVGDNAFQYGFFAGHEDFRPCTDPTVDICVTFAHRSIEEFFWSFRFLQGLDDGKSIGGILGSDCKEPIFMMNPLVLRFCLWLRTKFFGSQRIVYDRLVACAAQQIDFHVLDIDIVDEIFPAMGIRKALQDEDSIKLEFLKKVFGKCEHVRVLQIRPDNPFHWRDKERQDFGTAILEFLEFIVSDGLLSKLSLLSILKDSVPHVPPDANSSALTVSIKLRDSVSYQLISKIHAWLTKYGVKRDPRVCARINCKHSQGFKILVQKHTKEVHAVWSQNLTLYGL